MNKVMAALAIGLAAGGAIGGLVGVALLGNGPGTGSGVSLDVAQAHELDAPRKNAPPIVEVGVLPSESSPPPLANRAVRDVVDAPTQHAVTGEGLIHGQATDSAGEPLEGVTIRATRITNNAREPGVRGNGPPEERTLDEVVQEAVRQHQRDTSSRYETQTGADGRYQIARLPSDDFRLQAWKAGYSLKARQSSNSIRPDASVDFVATELVPVQLDIRLPDGSSAERSNITARRTQASGSRTSTDVWTRDHPELLLEAGYYTFTATVDPAIGPYHERVGDLQSKPAELDVSGLQSPLTLHLEGRRGIRGRITTEDGVPRNSTLVRIRKLDPGEAADPEVLKSSSRSSTWVRNRSDFQFLDLEAGRYAIGAADSWGSDIVVWAEVEVDRGLTECDLALPAINEQNSLIAKVMGPDGRPQPSVRFRYELKAPNNRPSGSMTAIERAPGEHWIVAPTSVRNALWDGPAIDGTVSIVVICPYGQQRVQVERGQHRFDVQFDASTMVLASVSGYVGSGLEGVLNLSLRGKTSGFNARSVAASSDGPSRLGPVEVGEYDLILTLSNRTGSRNRSYEIARTPFAATSPETRVAIAIPPLYTVTVVSPDSEKGSVTIRSQSGPVRVTQSVEAGQAQLELIPAGDYFVDRSRSSADGRMNISVPALTHVVFEARPKDSAWITVKDSAGLLAQAGFESGDVVISVAGIAFNGKNELNLALAKAVDINGATAEVLRDGTTITLPVDAAAWLKGSGLGGSWNVTYSPQ